MAAWNVINKSSNRPMLSSFKRSLRTKITISVVLPLLFILGSFTAIRYLRHKRAVLDNLSFLASQTSQVIEISLQQAMLSGNKEGLQNTLDDIGENEGIQVIYLMDASGRVVFAPKTEGVGRRLDHSDPACQPCHSLPIAERPGSTVVNLPDGERVFRSMNPIENRPTCQACHNPDERLLGLLLTDISMAPLESPLAADLRENLIWWVATILVTMLVANLAVDRFVIRRLEGLAAAIAGLNHEQLPPPLPDTQPDEIGQLASVFNAMTRRVEAREKENRTLSEDLRRQSMQRGELVKRLITAQEDERKRVARELHDELGQALTGLAFQAEVMQQLIISDPEGALYQLAQTRALINETAGQMYDLILALRPSALDDLGLAAALRANADRLLAGTGITFDLDSRGLSDRLQPEMETALYRIFQEALSNVLRHSGAEQVHIKLARRDNVFDGEIVDNGHGFDPQTVRLNGDAPRGLGLLGMQERVAQCGGQLEIISKPGSGTCIRIRIQLKERSDG